jgi:hypothetical protein
VGVEIRLGNVGTGDGRRMHCSRRSGWDRLVHGVLVHPFSWGFRGVRSGRVGRVPQDGLGRFGGGHGRFILSRGTSCDHLWQATKKNRRRHNEGQCTIALKGSKSMAGWSGLLCIDDTSVPVFEFKKDQGTRDGMAPDDARAWDIARNILCV